MIAFHIEGRTFSWSRASSEVLDAYGCKLEGFAYNMAQARKLAAAHIKKMQSRSV